MNTEAIQQKINRFLEDNFTIQELNEMRERGIMLEKKLFDAIAECFTTEETKEKETVQEQEKQIAQENQEGTHLVNNTQDFIDYLNKVSDSINGNHHYHFKLLVQNFPEQRFVIRCFDIQTNTDQPEVVDVWLLSADGGVHVWNISDLQLASDGVWLCILNGNTAAVCVEYMPKDESGQSEGEQS